MKAELNYGNHAHNSIKYKLLGDIEEMVDGFESEVRFNGVVRPYKSDISHD